MTILPHQAGTHGDDHHSQAPAAVPDPCTGPRGSL